MCSEFSSFCQVLFEIDNSASLFFRRSGEPGKAESFLLDCVRMYNNEAWPKLNADASERLARCYKQMCNVRRCIHDYCHDSLCCIYSHISNLCVLLTLLLACNTTLVVKFSMPYPPHPASFIMGTGELKSLDLQFYRR